MKCIGSTERNAKMLAWAGEQENMSAAWGFSCSQFAVRRLQNLTSLADVRSWAIEFADHIGHKVTGEVRRRNIGEGVQRERGLVHVRRCHVLLDEVGAEQDDVGVRCEGLRKVETQARSAPNTNTTAGSDSQPNMQAALRSQPVADAQTHARMDARAHAHAQVSTGPTQRLRDALGWRRGSRCAWT